MEDKGAREEMQHDSVPDARVQQNPHGSLEHGEGAVGGDALCAAHAMGVLGT